MTYSNPHSPVWGNAAHTIVNLMVTFDWLGEEVGFTASPYDVEEYGRELHARAIASEFGEIAEYEEPVPTEAQLVELEDKWRLLQLELIADQILAIEDEDPTALTGTDRQWRDYRTKVRAWKFGAINFPDKQFRPVSPDNINQKESSSIS